MHLIIRFVPLLPMFDILWRVSLFNCFRDAHCFPVGAMHVFLARTFEYLFLESMVK